MTNITQGQKVTIKINEVEVNGIVTLVESDLFTVCFSRDNKRIEFEVISTEQVMKERNGNYEFFKID